MIFAPDKLKTVIGLTTAAALLTYSSGDQPTNLTYSVTPNISLSAPTEMKFDYYHVSMVENQGVLEQIDIIHRFASNLLSNIKDLGAALL